MTNQAPTPTQPDPVADPDRPPQHDAVLTVRIQPPATRARRLALDTPRAVRVAGAGDAVPWALVDPTDATDLDPFLTDAQVADWPHTTNVEDGAAQRLARPREPARLLGPSTLPEDECESPFR